jgi:hypothetical protein
MSARAGSPSGARSQVDGPRLITVATWDLLTSDRLCRYAPLNFREESMAKIDLLQGTLDLLILRIVSPHRKHRGPVALCRAVRWSRAIRRRSAATCWIAVAGRRRPGHLSRQGCVTLQDSSRETLANQSIMPFTLLLGSTRVEIAQTVEEGATSSTR